jgi:hypothetical protein
MEFTTFNIFQKKIFLAIDSQPKKKLQAPFLPSSSVFLLSSSLLLQRIVFSFLCVVAIWSPPPLVRSTAAVFVL